MIPFQKDLTEPHGTLGLRFIGFDGLKDKGITFSKAHLRRLMSRQKFPPPIYLSQRRMAWPEHVIDAWMDAKWKEALGREIPLRDAEQYLGSA
ncbi:helix-turn-helix transcriptional regulator [Rhizobium sp.]